MKLFNGLQRGYRFLIIQKLVRYVALALIIVSSLYFSRVFPVHAFHPTFPPSSSPYAFAVKNSQPALSVQTLQKHQAIGTAATTVNVHGMVVEATGGQTTSLLTPYVAVFSDTNASSRASDFSATIDWGDSTPTTSGKVSQVGWSACQPWESHSPAVNCFKIDSNGEHTYTNPPLPGKLYSITVTVTKSDGQKIVPGQAFAEVVAPLANPPNPKFKQSVGVITIRYSTADSKGNYVYSCTATALADVNVILTARHCFPGWRLSSQLVEIQFAPAHTNQCSFNEDLKQCGGNALGVWSTTYFSDVHMATDTMEFHDAAFIVMKQPGNKGEYLTDALMKHTGVPGLPVIFNAFPNLSWTAYGYPTGYAQGYSGQKTSWNLHSCGILQGHSLGSNLFWISPCETLGVDKYQLIAGTSGGPWISNQSLPNGIGATNLAFCLLPTGGKCRGVPVPGDTAIDPPLDHTEMNLYIQSVQASQSIAGTITEYPLPTSGGSPDGITAGPDGNFWFTEYGADQIGKITPSGTITEYSIPTSGTQPRNITAGSDGNLWFTESNADQIGKITTGGTFTEYLLPSSNSFPNFITAGPDGNLWFTQYNTNQIGKITPGGTITEYPVPTGGSGLNGITTGPDGNLWFIESTANQIGKITTGGSITEYPLPSSGSDALEITAGPDGNLWFTDYGANQIGKITTGGTITEYPLPTGNSGLNGITTGPDGNLWFTEEFGNQIGKITTGGTITEYPLPTSSSDPINITTGPDSNLWFAEISANQIGKIIPR